MRGWVTTGIVLVMLTPNQVMAQQHTSKTVCQRGTFNTVECTTSSAPTAGEILKRGFENNKPPHQYQMQPMPDSGPESMNRAREMGRKFSQDGFDRRQAEADKATAKRIELFNAIKADPENAEMIAKIYGVPLSPEMRAWAEKASAAKVGQGNHLGRQ